MSAITLQVALSLIYTSLLLITAAHAEAAQNTWLRSSQPQQTLHGLMVSIEERLHLLDTGRWEQRLESLETTIRRLDTAFQDRLDKLERNLNSKELKDELTVEKLTHKVRDILDTSYDRYNRRLGYTEERLEMSFKKVQMSVEGSLNRIEKQEEDLQSEVQEVVSLLEDLKSHSSSTEDRINSTHRALHQHIQNVMSPSQEELQKISGSLEHLGSKLNSSFSSWTSQGFSAQADGPQAADLSTTLRKEINTEANKFTNKANNMYNDLWRRIVSVESMVKDLARLSNMTRRELMQDMRSLVLSDRRDFPGDSQENFMEVALEALERKLQRKLTDVGRKLEDRLDTLSASQNLVMDSCFEGGICRSLESRLSQVLENVFDVFSNKIETYSNRTFDLDSLVVEMMELVKNQHSHLLRTVTHNTNMVVTLSKDSSENKKLVHKTLTQLAEKIDNSFQELHDDLQDSTNTSVKICSEYDKSSEGNHDQTQQPSHTVHNIAEIVFVPLNSSNEKTNKTVNSYDSGVLKIMTDSVQESADNSTEDMLTETEDYNSTLSVDSSIVQIINTVSPSLKREQLEAMLLFLNSSVNLESLEAIIQNTEADDDEEAVDDEGSLEGGFETTNRTTLRSENTQNLNSLSDNINEIEDISEEVSEYTTEDISAQMYLTTNNNLGEKINKTNDQFLSEIPTDLKEHIKLYALLGTIKNGQLNSNSLAEQLNVMVNQSEWRVKSKLISILESLCYGEETLLSSTLDYRNIMRNRLLLVKNSMDNVDLYNRIENICNTITEYFIQLQIFSKEE